MIIKKKNCEVSRNLSNFYNICIFFYSFISLSELLLFLISSLYFSNPLIKKFSAFIPISIKFFKMLLASFTIKHTNVNHPPKYGTFIFITS